MWRHEAPAVWTHNVEAVGAALRYSARDGLRPPVVMVTGMGLPAVGTYLPRLAASALRRRRLLFVDPFACGYSDAPVSISHSLTDRVGAIAGLFCDRADAPCVLVGYAVACAIAGQRLPEGHYHLDRVRGGRAWKSCPTGRCGPTRRSCSDPRGSSSRAG